MADKSANDPEISGDEAEEKMDSVLKRMLETPPKPRKSESKVNEKVEGGKDQ